VHNREQIKIHLLDTISSELPARKLEHEGIVYRALGLVPDDFDYKTRVVDIYIGQIGGYYDPKKKRFVMADWSPAVMQNTVAIHELTHALQDQHFGLDKFVDAKLLNGDELLARSALVEGDATAVMMDYNYLLLGQPSLRERPDVQSLMMQNVLGAALSSPLQDVPSSLTALILFPYTSGLRFVHVIMHKGGYSSVDRIYLRPPRSSEEILHPEKYLQQDPSFENPAAGEVEAGLVGEPGDWKSVYNDVLGEFSISALLHQAGVRDNAEAAAGWGGDRVVLLEPASGAGSERLIAWKSRWDSVKDAEEFYAAYRKALQRWYPKAALMEEWSNLATGKKIKFQRDGKEVSIIVRFQQ